jgi:penicillin-binding protein 2
MFERRLKIFLVCLIVVTLALLIRAAQVQIISHSYWTAQAESATSDVHYLPTTRGRILDIRGRELAVDQPCIDACVDYRAIAREGPDAEWVKAQAKQHALSTRSDEYRHASASRKAAIIKEESQWVQDHVRLMFETLAKESHTSTDEIDAIRDSVVSRVRMRKRSTWYRRYESAMHKQSTREKPSWYRAWLLGDDADAPHVDEFDIKVEEETSPHVILRAIDSRLQNYLLKNLEEFPGLKLLPSMQRVYPFGDAACHVIGHMSRVTREDLEKDPELENELRGYKPNDVIGRMGLEALCEPMLRGTRGRESTRGDGAARHVLDSLAAIPGADVHSTIDIELQHDIQDMFAKAQIPWGDAGNGQSYYDTVPMHGAAVVIDVASGEVRAMVSYPTYDLNRFDELYPQMVIDENNTPLMNRATQAMHEPGSTVKPVVGLGAITQGTVGVNEGIECTGYLILGNHRYGFGRCWTASKFGLTAPDKVSHHQIPTQFPHKGHDGTADGFLTFSDALERSCNVYFETVADRLKMDGLSYWMERFGIGKPTGVGIAEVTGMVPSDVPISRRGIVTWTAGIGQGCVAATPIQMANVAATVARNGIWMKPKLISDQNQKLNPYKPSKLTDAERQEWDQIPDSADLKLSHDGLIAAHKGMVDVVNGGAGTGTSAQRTDMIVAGKTGTAQAAKFTRHKMENGHRVKDDAGNFVLEAPEPSTHEHPNPELPWYRAHDEDGKNLKHSWFIGFAPADPGTQPKIAFAVMVEYGGSGGAVAGKIGKGILDALIQEKYLVPEKHEPPVVQTAAR